MTGKLLFILVSFCWGSFLFASEHLSKKFEIARPAVDKLIHENDFSGLMDVIENSNFQELRLQAISEVELADEFTIDISLSVLDSCNQSYSVGGTEQEYKKKELLRSLATKIADTLGESPPDDFSRDLVEKFIRLARSKVEEKGNSSQRNRLGVTEAKKRVAITNKDREIDASSEKSFSLIYWILGGVALGGVSLLVWKSCKGSSPH